jgi:hypothetical protein
MTIIHYQNIPQRLWFPGASVKPSLDSAQPSGDSNWLKFTPLPHVQHTPTLLEPSLTRGRERV